MIHKQHYKRLAKKMTSCWKIFFCAFLALLIMAVTLSFLPILVQQIVHATFIEHNTAVIKTSLLATSLLLIVFGLADYSSDYMLRKAGNRLHMQLNSTLFSRLLNLPTQQYQNQNVQLAADKALINIKQISQSAVQIITVLVRDTMIIFSLMLCLFWLHRDYASLVLLLIPFAIIMLQVIQGLQHVKPQANSTAFSRLACHLQQSIKNYRQVRLYGGQHQEYQRLKKEALSIQNDELQQTNYKVFIATLYRLIMLLIVVAITYLMIQQVLRGLFTLDQIGAFVMATLLLTTPVKRLARISRTIQNEQKHLEQIFALLDLNTISNSDNRVLAEIEGKLTFEHICFFSQETGKPIPNRIDLDIKPGKKVVIVCKDKQARSLLIDLMLGFQQPEAGRMLLDNVPYTEIKHADLLAQFAMIAHEPIILDERVAGNIAYGATRCAHEAHITAVTQAAQASEFVREMPNGLQTRVDENGASMTNEQWQKIEIARALLKNAPILIMDNVWFQSSAQTSFNDALTTLIQNRTTIIVMQSLPTSRQNIDRIYFLDEGTVSEK